MNVYMLIDDINEATIILNCTGTSDCSIEAALSVIKRWRASTAAILGEDPIVRLYTKGTRVVNLETVSEFSTEYRLIAQLVLGINSETKEADLYRRV